MPTQYRILIHSIFQGQVDNFIEDHFDKWEAVLTQFRKIANDPLHDAMSALPPPLCGKVFHVHVSGRKGYRLIYIAEVKRRIVLPVFISSVIKSQFDYNDVPWQEYADQIFSDICNNKMHKFSELNLISKRK